MTIINYDFRLKKSLPSNVGIIQKIEDQTYIAQENKPDMESVRENKLPSSNIDSRSLIENQVSTMLSLEAQEPIRQNLIVMVTEAIEETKRNKTDKKQQIFGFGNQESLQTAINDLQAKECLYKLIEKYSQLATDFLKITENEIDLEELDFPQTRHKGTSSSYLNLVKIISDKLGKTENSEFMLNNLQPIR